MLIDPKLRTIFDTLYVVLGVDIQYMRDQLLEQFDRALTKRITENVLADFSSDQRGKYAAFVSRTPAFTPKDGAQFLKGLCGLPYLDKVAKQQAKVFSQEYLKQILKGSTMEQRKQVQNLLQGFSKGYPQQ